MAVWIALFLWRALHCSLSLAWSWLTLGVVSLHSPDALVSIASFDCIIFVFIFIENLMSAGEEYLYAIDLFKIQTYLETSTYLAAIHVFTASEAGARRAV